MIDHRAAQGTGVCGRIRRHGYAHVHCPNSLLVPHFSEAKKELISEINLQLSLEGLRVKMSKFIDLCILLGCDYLEPIKGIGCPSQL